MNRLFAHRLPFRLLAGLLLVLPAVPPCRAAEAWTSLHNGGNTSLDANLPLAWSPDKGIAWSAALPGYGQSAPVVWGGRVYITAIEGDNKETCFVHAYDAKTGRRAWQYKFAAATKTKNSYMTSRAAPTPVVDRDGVYALFESGDLHALTHDGKKRWAVALFDDTKRKFDNAHGYGASPTQTSKAVVVLVDHRGPSYLLALSKETGEQLWKTERKSRSSWTSPQVTRVAKREQVIVSSSGTVDGYDAQTGKQLWSHTGLSGNGIPSVTVQGERVYVGAGLGQREKDADSIAASNCCLRIAPDLPAGYEVVWKASKAVCHYVSPLVHRGHAYYVDSVGVLHCLDARTGKEAYVKRTGGPCWAEPIASGEHVYLFHKDARTTVLKAGPRFETVTTNRLWKEGSPPLPDRSYEYEPQGPKDPRPRKPAAHYLDPIVYGVAAVDGAFFVRLGTHLYCVRGK
jgi:outer membrane protein assembly factor BamB